MLVGTVPGVGPDRSLPVLVGVVAGLILGVTVGGLLAANGVLPALWLVVVPAGMIGGGAVGARRSGQRRRS